MSRRIALLATATMVAPAAAVFTTAPAVAARRTANPNPTPAQVRAAVRKAQRSSWVWATVNICDTPRHRDQLGVRAQMPALGFRAALSMHIDVEYFTGRLFKPDPGVGRLIRLGTVTAGLHQGGHTFQFGPHAGLLAGTVTFQWRRSGRLIGQTTRPTTAGHHRVDFGDPPGHSAATCRIR